MTELSTTEIEPSAYHAPSWEMGARYFAAYACMAISVSAAWPVLQAPFGPILLLLLSVGLPLSLWLRSNGVRWKGRPINRLMLSSLIMLSTFVLSTAFISASVGFGAFSGGLMHALMIFSAGRSVELMIGVFLIFGVSRCLFLLTDKDAFLCTLPSFAVLFLLIVAQREPVIVLDFIGWTLMTATLLALDHRHESRRGLSGFVTANVPGQDVKLSVRSLATIMVVSLSCSVALSYTLAAGDPNNRSAFEAFMRLVAGSLSNVSNDTGDNPNSTTQAEPQALIDYRSGPPLPTRTVLWKMGARLVPRAVSGQRRNTETVPIFPTYWRLSSLATYDGAAWSLGSGVSILDVVAPKRTDDQSGINRQVRFYDLRGGALTKAQRDQKILETPLAPGRARIVQILTPVLASSGSVPLPLLPNANFVLLGRTDNANVRTNREGAVTLSETHITREIDIVSDVTPVPEYGGLASRNSALPLNSKLKLSNIERKLYLQLPKMPVRVLDLARRLAGSDPSPLHRAENLEAALPKLATYTLRPPNLPDERDATDFFLFESRRGYCTHFAGALTVLCREIGIPARVVSGFANVEREVNEDGRPTGFALARSSNAHAWTEIWLDGVGWVPLDATPADDRGDNSPTVWGDLSDRFTSALAALWASIQSHSALWIGGVVGLLMVTLAGFFTTRRLRERSLARGLASRLFGARLNGKRGDAVEDLPEQREDLATRATIFSVYRKASKTLARRFRPRASWQTPHDWLHEAQTELPDVDLTPLQNLTDLHRRAMYNPQLFSAAERERVREIQTKIKRHKYVAAK